MLHNTKIKKINEAIIYVCELLLWCDTPDECCGKAELYMQNVLQKVK